MTNSTRWDRFTKEELKMLAKVLSRVKRDPDGDRLLKEIREHRKKYNR